MTNNSFLGLFLFSFLILILPSAEAEKHSSLLVDLRYYISHQSSFQTASIAESTSSINPPIVQKIPSQDILRDFSQPISIEEAVTIIRIEPQTTNPEQPISIEEAVTIIRIEPQTSNPTQSIGIETTVEIAVIPAPPRVLDTGELQIEQSITPIDPLTSLSESYPGTFCKQLEIAKLYTSPDYNVIDNHQKKSPQIVDGTDGNDLYIASPHGDAFRGMDGNDCILGGAGNDILQGMAGNDSIWGYGGDDELIGGNGNDWLLGMDGNDLLSGKAGKDNLRGGKGNDNLNGGMGNDNMLGQAGDDKLIGGKGDDLMKGNAGTDTCIKDPNDSVAPANCKLVSENTFSFGGTLESQQPPIDIMSSAGNISTEKSSYSQGPKSLGNLLSETNSGKVCGLSLCSETLSIKQRIDLYLQAIGFR